MHICTFLNPHTLENNFEGAFNDFARLHPPIMNKKLYFKFHIFLFFKLAPLHLHKSGAVQSDKIIKRPLKFIL